MLDRAAIRSKLRKRLLATAGLFGASDPTKIDQDKEVSWQNKGFKPPNPGKLWLRESLAWGAEIRAATNLLEGIGFAQYDVYVPSGSGTATADAAAKKIGDQFRVGTDSIGEGAAQIAIQRAEVLTGVEGQIGDQVWYQVPVRVTFRAYSPNNE